MIVPVQPPLGTLASSASSHKAAPIGGKAPPPFTFVPVSCLPSRPGGRWPPALPRQGRHPLAERLRRHFLLYLFQPALPVKEARFQEPQMLCASDATSKNPNRARSSRASSFRATALVPQRASTFTVKQRRPLAIKSVPSRYLFPSKCTFRLIRPILLFTADYTNRAQPVQRTLLDKSNHDHLPSSWSRLHFPPSFPCNRRAADLLLSPRHGRTVSRVT